MLIRVLAAVGAAALLPYHANGKPLLQRDVEPCQQVRDVVNKWFKDNNIVPRELTLEEQGSVPKVPAVPIKPSLAYACLKSVPLDRAAALKQLDYLRPFYEWQSSLDLLKDPPYAYLSQSVDILGGLDEIAKKLNWNLYPRAFDFLADLYTLTMVRPRDGHLRYNTLIFDLFSFEWGVKLVSVSKDGRELPELFLYDDIKADSNGYTPSPVVRIDGINAQDYVEKRSAWNGGSHDPDARYNTMFPSLSKDNHFTEPPAYDVFHLDLQDTTQVELQNGTKLEFQNHAFVRGNFSEISSGGDLYKVYGHPDGKGQSPLNRAFYVAAERNFTHQYTGYPKALDNTRGHSMAVFLPDEDGLNDTAVLSIGSFVSFTHPLDPVLPTMANQVAEYARVMNSLVREAKATGRNKLIIDLQSNAGGYLTSLAAIYFSLFPGSNVIPILWELRAHPQLQWLGTELERAGRLFDRFSLPQNWLSDYTQPNGTAWPNFSSLYGPLTRRSGVHVTQTSLINTTALFANSFANYTPLPWTTPPFSPQNIILLTSGECASSCAIFTSILTHHHGIRTTAIGGRPLLAPMQAIGQVNGGPGQSTWRWTAGYAAGLNRSTLPGGTRWFDEENPPMRVSQMLVEGDSTTFNFANIYPLKEEEGVAEWEKVVPLQFRYRTANCRLFYTWEGVRRVSRLWEMVGEVAWGGGRCVRGSTTDEEGKMGEGRVDLDKEVVGDRWALGAGVGAG